MLRFCGKNNNSQRKLGKTMKKISTLALSIALSLGLAACSTEPKTEVAAVSGIELQNFDASVRHQDDFYYSVNGNGWQIRLYQDRKSVV